MDSLQEQISYWKKSADINWKTAEGLFKLKRYDSCLFFCHLTIEKLLKGLVVIKTKKQTPFIHNLERLVELAKIAVPENRVELLKTITDFNMACRYDNAKLDFYKKCTKSFAKQWFSLSKEVVLWLKKEYPKQ